MTYPPPPEHSDPNPDPAFQGGYPPPPVGPPAPPDPGAGAYPPPAYPPPDPGAQPGYPPPGYPPQAPGAYPPGGYPPPAPGYGPPPGYPPPYGEYPPPRRRRRWPWIVGGTVLVIVVALVIIGVVFGRKGSGDPHTAVDKFWSAVAAHDRAKAEKYVCNGKNLKGSDIDQFVNEVQSYEIGPESGSGNTRIYPVTVHLTLNGQPEAPVIDTTAKKSAGKWYVCNVAVH